jgi:hypothetical protein
MVIFAEGNDSEIAELVRPASVINVIPVMTDAASLHKNTSGLACSIGVDTSMFAAFR